MTDSIVRIQTCGGHACAANGIKTIFELFASKLKIDPEKGGLSADGKFELTKGLACQGKCAVGPIVNAWKGKEKYQFSRMDAAKVTKIIEAFR